MSKSAEERRGNIQRAFEIMMDELGDDAFREKRFASGSPTFSDVLPTTWLELENLGLIEEWMTPIGQPNSYRLTGRGWIRGLEMTHRISEDLREAGIRFRTALKDQVKGRKKEAFVYVNSGVAGLSWKWCINAVEGNLLEHLFPGDDVAISWATPAFR